MTELMRIDMLGGMRVRQGERTITRFRTHKTGALLAYLAYHRNRSAARDTLIEILWPDTDSGAARHSLSQALSSLRNQLEPPGTPSGSILVADRFSIELNPTSFTTDIAGFERDLRSAASAKQPDARTAALTRAVHAWTGPLLPEYYEDWVAAERRRLDERFQRAIYQLAHALEQAGEPDRGAEELRFALLIDPLREDAHREIMRLLLKAGQPAAALRQFQELERVLADQLGDQPDRETRQLARKAEEQRASQISVPPARLIHPKRRENHPHDLPLRSGTWTFLATDIEGSTAQWEAAGEAFPGALSLHHAILRGEFRRWGGCELKEAGDSFLVAFASASDALGCAVASQRVLAAQPWPAPVGEIRVRMALHTGDVDLEGAELQGFSLHIIARILDAGHGGQILCSQATAGLLRRDTEPGLELRDLGAFRLRDVDLPERLFQVEYPDMPQLQFAPLAAEPVRKTSLPLQFTRFFGREQEIERLKAMLLGGEARLITLVGPGGTGKTRLALQVAGRLAEPLAGAVWFVPLVDVHDAAQIAGNIAHTLGLPRSESVSPLDQVVVALRSQPSLLVLDNLEHLVQEGASVVQSLLEQAPTLAVLATSRQALGLPGEREFNVPPLPTPNGQHVPDRLGLFESVRLFVDRAQAVKPDFQVTNNNAAAVAELCDRLEGIPLAIELAAARAQVLTPHQMLAYLQNRFEFLVTRKRGIAERQRTLKATVDWSYRLLPPDLQRFFAKLSIFAGGWTEEAAEAVCAEPLALDCLAQLRECSLVLTDDTRSTIRFRMLDSLREYAAGELTPEERSDAERRHAEYFLTLAESGESAFHGPDPAAWLERLDTDQANLRAALEWAASDSGSVDVGLRLAGALWRFWVIRGYAPGVRQAVNALLPRSEAAPAGVRANALAAAANLADYEGDWSAARALLEECLAIRMKVGDKAGAAEALLHLGLLDWRECDYDGQRRRYERALDLSREAGDVRGIAGALVCLGALTSQEQDATACVAHLEEGLMLFREAGDRRGIASALGAAGAAEAGRGQYRRARVFQEEWLSIARHLGDRREIGIALNHLAFTARDMADYEVARLLLEEAVELFRDTGDRGAAADALDNLSGVAREQADYQRARSLGEEVMVLARAAGKRAGIAWAIYSQGLLAARQDDLPTARALLAESLSVWREQGYPWGLFNTLLALASVVRKQTQLSDARDLVAEGLAIWRGSPSRLPGVRLLEELAAVEATGGHAEHAVLLFGVAAAQRAAMGTPIPPLDVEELQRSLDSCRTRLGDQAFAKRYNEGASMTLEQAVELAGRELAD